MKKILLLDGNTRSALAVTRSLGALGYLIEVGETGNGNSLSASSKFSKQSFSYPDPKDNQSAFLDLVLNKLKSNSYDLLLSTSDHTLQILYQAEVEIRKLTNFPFVSKETFDKVQDKLKLLELAKKHDLLVPRTQKLIAGKNDLEGNLDSLRDCHFPLFLKPRSSSQTNHLGKLIKAPNAMTENLDEVRNFLSNPDLEGIKFIAQEKITGVGEGLFLLFSKGECVAHFSHQRILEKPPEGGVSVLSKSIPTDESLLKKANRLLKELSWEGVAMVEFKRGADNNPYLMEINPRFWGSLQLSIDCGVNFPALLVDPSHKSNTQNNYVINQMLRWELGTLDHALINLKREGSTYFSRVFYKNALQLLNSKTKLELLRLNDPGPFFMEILNYFRIC